jgi:hypothetical protein
VCGQVVRLVHIRPRGREGRWPKVKKASPPPLSFLLQMYFLCETLLHIVNLIISIKIFRNLLTNIKIHDNLKIVKNCYKIKQKVGKLIMDVKSVMTDEMRIFLRENIRGVLAELILELETPSEVKQFAEEIIYAWTETQKELKTKFKNKKSKK